MLANIKMITMAKVLLLAILAGFSASLTADLKVLQYDPFVLQLSFSAPTAQPKFQLLYNNEHVIPHTLLSN
jgi:hypothetical protein